MRTRRMRAARPRRTTVKRQAFGNFASAMQQRDATNVVINTQEEFTLGVPRGSVEATGVRNINALMTTAPMFFNYATMYDQFKLNAVRISVEMTYISNNLLNSATFPSICTAWDRNGIRPRIEMTAAQNGVRGYLLPVYATVSSYSSANEKTLYYGAKWSVIRQLDASSMMEKSIYVGTVNTKDILTTDNLYGAWNPQFLISIKTPQQVIADSSCIFQIHYQFDVTMRGLRKIAYTSTQQVNGAYTLEQQLKPSPRFMGYTPSNYGYIVPSQLPGADYTVVQIAQPANAAAINNVNEYPTINPNMVEVGGNVNQVQNDGIYMQQAGIATNNIRL